MENVWIDGWVSGCIERIHIQDMAMIRAGRAVDGSGQN